VSNPHSYIPGPMQVPVSKSVTAVAATDIFTSTAHGYVAGNALVFSALTGGAGITPGQVYYVIAANLAANTFQVSATLGGTALDVTSDLTGGTVVRQFTWVDIQSWFPAEHTLELAKWLLRTQPSAVAPGTIVDGTVLRNWYQYGFLP
jgi:hypothetical protein